MEQNNQANQLVIDTVDADSIKRRFGWESIAGSHKIPYILRTINGEHLKFVSVRMAETDLLKERIHFFHPEIYKICIPIKCQHITIHEASLLTEINLMCDSLYGKDKFIPDKEFIVSLEDAQEFYIFLELCSKKILGKYDIKKFGYLRCLPHFNIVLPFYTINDQQFIPLMFFCGDIEPLQRRSVIFEKWNLAYLKFCCELMFLRDELYADEYCAVVSFDVAKEYIPQWKNGEEFFPPNFNKVPYIANQNAVLNPPGSWIRPQEAIPAPKTIPKLRGPPRSIPLMMMNNNQIASHKNNTVVYIYKKKTKKT